MMHRLLALLFAAVVLSSATPALAQNAPSNAFTTNWSALDPGDDWSATIIKNVFPTGGPARQSVAVGGGTIQPSESNVIGQIFGQFTGFIMAIAAAWVAYATVIQIHRAAETGRVLSNTTSSWAPVRLFLAIIMMLPMPSGFSAGQGAVVQVALWGIGMARTLYTNAIQSIGPDAMPLATPLIPGTHQIVAGLLENELCRQLVNLASGNVNMVPEPTPATGGAAGNGGYITWSYSMSAGDAVGDPVCGTVSLQLPGQPPNMAGVNVDMSQKQEDALASVLSQDIQPAAQEIAQTFWQTRQASAMTPLMSAYTKGASDYTQLLTQDATAVAQQLQAAFTANNARDGDVDLQQGQNQLAALGWTSAGAYYLEIANLDGRTLSLMAATPTVSAPTYQGLGPSLSSDLAPLVASILTFQAELQTYVQTADATSAPGGNADIVTGTSTNENNAGILSAVLDKINLSEPAIRAIMNAVAPTNNQWQDPFAALIHLGHVLATIALTALGLAVILASSTGSAAATAWNLLTFNWAGAAATFTGHILMGFLGVPIFYGCLALLIPGLILAFVLPMVPYATWIAGVVGWLILVFETIVAVPLWAFAHLTFQGDGLHGRGAEGYGLIVNVLVRPSLMLIGLFLGYYVFTCASWLLFQSFGVAMHFVIQNGWLVTNLAGAIIMISMFVLLHMMVALVSFRLISLIPHHVIKMIGFAPANRVDMDEFARHGTSVGMAATLGKIDGGVASVANYAGRLAIQQDSRRLAGPGAGKRPLQIGMDSTVNASSEITPPAAPEEEG